MYTPRDTVGLCVCMCVCVCVCVCVCIRACLRERHREMVCQLIGKEIETQQDQPVYYTHVVNEVKWNISTNWTGC